MPTVREDYGYSISNGEVGIEIEMEGDKFFPIPPEDSGWRATTDGSLRGHAIEYVSNGPINPDRIDQHLDTLQNILKENKIKIANSFRAGVHVHINVREMTLDEIANYALLYYIFEEPLVRYCGPNREGNLFCLRLQDAETPIEFLFQALRQKNFRLLDTDLIRYSSLNFAAIARHGSLEFRALETTSDFSKISLWAKILFNMREFAKKNNRSTFGELFSLLGPETFLGNIIGEEASKTFLYDGFEKAAITGMRRVQHLFYV